MAADGTIEDLDAGRPLRAVGCEPIELPAGETRLELPAGVRRPVPRPPAFGRSAGTARRRAASSTPEPRTAAAAAPASGSICKAPARLVLAESYNRGRRATCDGQDLGEPEVGAGFGTAWRVPQTCRNVTIAFAPNRLVTAGYAVSAVVGLLLLALLLIVGGRRRGPTTGGAPGSARDDGCRRGRAALIAVPAALALGLHLRRPRHAALLRGRLPRPVARDRRPAARAGGRRDPRDRRPVLTLIIRPEDRGGYNPEYAIDRIAVHWVAVAGITLLILALSRAMARPGRARAAPPTAAARPARAP